MRLLLLTACLLATLAGCAGGLRTSYVERRFGSPGGYTARGEGPGRWRVEGMSTAFVGPEFAQNMALYRGAILAKAAGFAYVQIVDFRIYEDHQFGSRNNSYAELHVVGVNDPAAPLDCVAESLFRVNCRTLSVDRTIAQLGPLLAQTPAQAEAEIAAARASPPPSDR